MKKLCSMLGVGLMVLSLTACAAKEKADVATQRTMTESAPPESAPPVVSGSLGAELVQVRATVEAIDVKKRTVRLKGPKGNSETFEVDKEVRNLPQVKKGDTVIVEYYESAAYEVRKPGQGTPGVTVAATGDRAELGEKPAASGARTVTVTSTIEAIDKKRSSVTLRGPDGDLVDIRVKDPKKLAAVKAGDLVEISYTRAVAVKVETPPK